MKRLESNQTEQSWFCCPIHFTGVNCRRQDFRTVLLIYLLRIYDSIHVDQVYRKQYIRNIVKNFFRDADMYISKHINKKNNVDEIADASRLVFLGIFNQTLSCKGPEYQRLFLFQLNSASGNGLRFRSI